MASAPRAAGGAFTTPPAALPIALGVLAVIIVAAALLLSGGDKKKDDPNARRPGVSGVTGDFPTLTAPNAIPTPTPQLAPSPTRAPSPTPQPAATPSPAQPQQAQVPEQKTSPFVNLRVTPGGHGQTLKLGTPVQLCYGVSGPGIWVRVYDVRTGEVLFPEGVDDGTGDCRNDLSAGPVGVDTVQADAYFVNPNGTRGAIRGSASLSMVVVP